MSRTIATIKSVKEYLADGITAFKGTKAATAMVEALPWWSEELAQVTGQAVPGIGVILKYYEKHTFGAEAYEVGLKACTMAMQRAMAEAVDQLGPPQASADLAGADTVASKLCQAEVTTPENLEGFNWLDWRTHPFTKRALDDFEETARALGYRDREQDTLRASVMMRFPHHLNTLLTNRDLAARFKPFADYLNNVDEGTRVRLALQHHAQLMARIYHDQPLFGQEAFSLSQVYVKTECGSLTWDEINSSRQLIWGGHGFQEKQIDPFDEEHGGRSDAVETIMNLITDPKYDEPIVIQGTAGSGKSSLTLHLCDHLLSLNLVPILIRLRDLHLGTGIATTDALKNAIRLKIKDFGPDQPTPPRVDDLFDRKTIWDDPRKFEQITLCRYVLILDGWDELSITSESSFKNRAEHLLTEVRRIFIDQPLPIRLIVTGRPSRAIAETGFLKEKTCVLTLRPLQPRQIDTMVSNLIKAQKLKRFKSSKAFTWKIDMNKVKPLAETYRETRKNKQSNRKLEIINSPLLAFLALRLVHETQYNPYILAKNPTLLYRELVNLTCAKGGQPHHHDYDPSSGNRFSGRELRRLLQYTAVAMFICDQDNLSYQELDYRLDLLDPRWSENSSLYDRVDRTKHVCPLMDLMISYFFKGGNQQLGCEFSHKSFREYLYAEALVSRLQTFGCNAGPWGKAAEGCAFWDETKENHPLGEFAEDLVRLTASHRVTPEIHRHIFALLESTIREDLGNPDSLVDWVRIRDGLAEIWAWWMAAIPQRNVPRYIRKKRRTNYDPSLFAEMSEEFLPVDSQDIRPRAIGSLDAHCGEVFWQLNSVIHFEIARCENWLKQKDHWHKCRKSSSNDYQAVVPKPDKGYWVLFAPGGTHVEGDPMEHKESFIAISRINASEESRHHPFPTNARLQGNFLAHSYLRGINAGIGKMSVANFSNSNLAGATLCGANLYSARLDRARLDRANLYSARLVDTSLDRANLNHAGFHHSEIRNATFLNANLTDSEWVGAKLTSVDFTGSNISRKILVNAIHNRSVGIPESSEPSNENATKDEKQNDNKPKPQHPSPPDRHQ